MATSKTSKVRGRARTTIDHDEIREWVERHGGHPAVVKRSRKNGDPGILRIDFPGYSGEESLEPVDWDEFFQKFEDAQLAFAYQDETASGRPSRFNKLISREGGETAEPEEGPGTRRAPRAKARAKAGGTARRAPARGAKARPRARAQAAAPRRGTAKKTVPAKSRGRAAAGGRTTTRQSSRRRGRATSKRRGA
jgi:hypothetical protein